MITNTKGKFILNKELNMERIYEDYRSGRIDNHIHNALKKIHDIEFIHGDTRLDNIGIKQLDTGEYQYVLFDFGASLFNDDNNPEKYRNDYDTYESSKSTYLQLK